MTLCKNVVLYEAYITGEIEPFVYLTPANKAGAFVRSANEIVPFLIHIPI